MPPSKLTYQASKSDIPEKLRLQSEDILQLDSGTYQITGEIGRGGFAHVYRIENDRGDVYAIKVLDMWLMRPEEYDYIICKFKQEVASGQIPSKRIVRSYSSGYLLGNPYVIMDYCPNDVLSKRIQDFSDESKYTQLGIALLEGLRDLHQNGIIHRDLKPENILFDVNDEAKITDFGIAGFLNKRLTSRNFIGMVSQVWGTPLYASPEQLDHSKAYKLTAPTMDLFSFGVIMYEIIARGKHPYGVHKELLENPDEYLRKVKKRMFEPLRKYRPEAPEAWLQVIEKCLSPKPKDRIGSAAEMLKLLEETRSNSYDFHPNTVNSESSVGLKVIQGEQVGRVYSLEGLIWETGNQILTLGWYDAERNVVNDVAIKEDKTKYISRMHATLEKHNGSWVISDGQEAMGNKNGTTGIDDNDKHPKDSQWKPSLNGTFVNYNKIDKQQLEEGDIVSVGDAILKFTKI
jgi:serine/threonine protein kinase